MNAVPKRTQGQQLTVQQQVQKAFNSEATERDLIAMVAATVSLTAITNEAGYEQVKRAHLTLRNARVEVEKTGKAARDEAIKVQKAVLIEERRLIAIVTPEEDRLQALRQAVDDRIEAERQRQIEAERQRAEALQAQIANLEKLPASVAGKSAAQILAVLKSVREMKVNEDTFAEFTERARDSMKAVEERLEEMHGERIAFEQQQAELAQQREAQRIEQERLDKERREREVREAEERRVREAQERTAREEQERKDREQRDREETERAAERQRIADEQERVDQAKRELEEQRAAIAREREELEAAKAPPPAPTPPPPEPRPVLSSATVAPVLADDPLDVTVPDPVRPAFSEIVDVLAAHYAVEQGLVIDWLASFFSALSVEEVQS